MSASIKKKRAVVRASITKFGSVVCASITKLGSRLGELEGRMDSKETANQHAQRLLTRLSALDNEF